MATARVLRLALVGQGAFLERYRSIASRVRGVQITAHAEVDANGKASREQPSPAENKASDLADLLSNDSDQFDAVVFQSADAASEEFLVRMASAGKHILCAESIDMARAQVACVSLACQESGVCFLPGLRGRFSPSVRTILESVDSGRLGAPGLLRIHKWISQAGESESASGHNGQAISESTFVPLVDEIDLTYRVFKRLPILAYAKATSAFAGEPADRNSSNNYLQLHLAFPEGGMALLDVATKLRSGEPYYSVSVIGATGAAYADDHHNKQLLFGGGLPVALSRDTVEVQAAGQLREFCTAIGAGRAPSPSADDFVQVLDVAHAAVESLSTGSPVPVKGAG